MEEGINGMGQGLGILILLIGVITGVKWLLTNLYRYFIPYKVSLKDLKKHDRYHDNDKRLVAFTHPEKLTKVICHGACLDCVTPIKQGVGVCRSCDCFTWDRRVESKKQTK